MSNFIIQTQKLTKNFGSKTHALTGLDINIPEGVVYGLVGRNGAGKTTTLRILMGLLKATSGNAQIMGQDPWQLPLELKQKIGYASDTMQLLPWLKVGEILNYNGNFYPSWDVSYVKQWLDRLKLPIDQRVFQLSKGNKQKLGLIMAIGHKPKLVILDEPAGGLDPIARKEFLESMIELIHESGTTIVLSSHLLGDLERIAEHIGIIDNGKMCLETSLDDLKNTTRQIKIVNKTKINSLDIDGIIRVTKSDNIINAVISNWNKQKYEMLKQKYPDSTIEVENLNLEEIFFSYTGEKED